MTQTTSAISYVNLARSVTSLNGAWETNAPLSNILTPRIGQKAIARYPSGEHIFEFAIDGGSPTLSAYIGVVAILGHNIIQSDSDGDIEIALYAEDGSFYSKNTPVQFNQDGVLQNNYIWIPEIDYPEIATKKITGGTVTIYDNFSSVRRGIIDPYTGEITEEPLSIGGIWMGPKFSPINGFKLETFTQSVIDESSVIESRGGQVWADPEVRRRFMSVTMGALYESEVYANAPTQCLQQMGVYAGTSRPVLVIPTSSTDALMYQQGIYGYMPTPPKWNAFDKSKRDGTLERLYSGSFELKEAK